MKKSQELRQRRAGRVRTKLAKVAKGRVRLSVYRSERHIYAQIIKDDESRTLVSASSLEKDMRESLKSGSNKDAAIAVGKRLAERAVKAGITEVAFDRGGYPFHGRVKALADAAREGGLQF